MTKSSKVRLPHNRPDEVSIIQAAGQWRVFVREGGRFAVRCFAVEDSATIHAQAERKRLGLMKVETIGTHL